MPQNLTSNPLVGRIGGSSQDYPEPPEDDTGSDAYERNKAWARPAPPEGYLTKLGPQEEKRFRNWVTLNNIPFDPSAKADYDMRGFFQAAQVGDPKARQALNANDGQMHFPDYWKTPYHETFSGESKWATADAPRWNNKDQLVSKDGQIVYDEKAAQRSKDLTPSKLEQRVAGGLVALHAPADAAARVTQGRPVYNPLSAYLIARQARISARTKNADGTNNAAGDQKE